MTSRRWAPSFLEGDNSSVSSSKSALIILNQPFSLGLLWKLWRASSWKACADGGANRLYDSFSGGLENLRSSFLPDLIKGDFDSIREEVKEYYSSKGVAVVLDEDQDSTDLMKCTTSLFDLESQTGGVQHDTIILGGLSGRLDHTIHTLSYIHKLRKLRESVFAITDDNVAWVLDSGEHEICVNHKTLGRTCGLLPVGIGSTTLTTRGLRWNLTDHPSHFDGMVSTSNHLVPEEPIVYVKTTEPVWWTVRLRPEAFTEDPETIVLDIPVTVEQRYKQRLGERELVVRKTLLRRDCDARWGPYVPTIDASIFMGWVLLEVAPPAPLASSP